ncbi:MAG: hypothetical protein ABFS09_01795 [Thermodesulfobacteriota bacterium]
MRRKFKNAKADAFLAGLAELSSIEDDDNDLTIRCKFNFSYFVHSQPAGQNFNEWTHKQLSELFAKLKDYTAKPLDYWLHERIGGGGLKVLAIYGEFPAKSSFTRPSHVPHQAEWGRFRLGSKIRLVGFKIPSSQHMKTHPKTGNFFDKNTFYVVFLDREHKFYLAEKK